MSLHSTQDYGNSTQFWHYNKMGSKKSLLLPAGLGLIVFVYVNGGVIDVLVIEDCWIFGFETVFLSAVNAFNLLVTVSRILRSSCLEAPIFSSSHCQGFRAIFGDACNALCHAEIHYVTRNGERRRHKIWS